MSPAGFLHSDICGSMAICASPQLFAACRVLLRQISPRHPPYALSILTYGTYFVCVHLDLLALSFLQCARNISLMKSFLRYFYIVFKEQSFFLFPQASLRYGGDEENRTPDPLLARQVLSQLSYTPIWSASFRMAVLL